MSSMLSLNPRTTIVLVKTGANKTGSATHFHDYSARVAALQCTAEWPVSCICFQRKTCRHLAAALINTHSSHRPPSRMHCARHRTNISWIPCITAFLKKFFQNPSSRLYLEMSLSLQNESQPDLNKRSLSCFIAGLNCDQV